MQQPIFLELEAPLKICGTLLDTQGTSMDNILTYSDSSITESILPRPTICSLAIMSIEENFPSKLSVYSWHIRLSTQEISSFFVETMSAPQSIEFMAFTISVHIFEL